ncbi:putative deoxyhypusine synthase [Eufriesea mexicana]|uniref:deoxyhypusine synthase n=1 Tax=Eufriesea mexicana TaxID=516756 RepID=A0A310SN71_9HYME|nr:putative deoxyhypusine synthase [Eufriesea mexicana]
MSDEKQDSHDEVPELVKNAVLVHSSPIPIGTPIVKGYDWNKGIDYHFLFETYKNSGFQATNFGLAVDEIHKMLNSRNIPLENDQIDILEEDKFIERKSSCTIFLGYTSNMASCGIRDTIRFLVQHKMVDCIVTTAGGIEEDLIKCLAPTYIGDFHLEGKSLRQCGINRIGNLLVPNDNYCLFEDWVMPILDAMLAEQKTKGTVWTPSKIITRLGEEINNENSIYYWAAKNKIPVFSPALTDGSLGDMMYFHTFRNPGLIIDILSDLRRLNTMAMKAVKSGMIIIGGGIVKHHICNANLMRNGADYAVFINTSSEFDGSDSGARPDEAISWGKIRMDAKPVKLISDVRIVLIFSADPLRFTQTVEVIIIDDTRNIGVVPTPTWCMVSDIILAAQSGIGCRSITPTSASEIGDLFIEVAASLSRLARGCRSVPHPLRSIGY